MQSAFVINGKEVDLTKLGVTKMADWCNLLDQGVNYRELDDVRNQIKFTLYMVNKVNPEITRDDLLNMEPLEFRDLAVAIQNFSVSQKEIESPLENGSSS